MARAPGPAKAPKPIKLPAPKTTATPALRMKPSSTREYGKGGTPLSGNPNANAMGAGIGYGGPDDV